MRAKMKSMKAGRNKIEKHKKQEEPTETRR
jgi:hypothetical protein